MSSEPLLLAIGFLSLQVFILLVLVRRRGRAIADLQALMVRQNEALIEQAAVLDRLLVASSAVERNGRALGRQEAMAATIAWFDDNGVEARWMPPEMVRDAVSCAVGAAVPLPV